MGRMLQRRHTVGEVARLTGVTVRTLHHYDEIGLLIPSERSDAGYRLHGGDDLERLQEILTWRALGFALPEIAAMLDEPGHDREQALLRQRALVETERVRLEAIARALDATLAAHRNGTKVEVTTMFDGFDPADYEDEVRERWGESDAYRESARRTAGYGPAEWAQIRVEAEAIVTELARLHAGEQPADGGDARAAAERHRQHLTRWFYDVSPQMHRNLAEMYVSDPRFAAHYDTVTPGLAGFVRDAINANAGANGDADLDAGAEA